MLLSSIGNHDTPYYRMERAILRLVRGSLYRRLSANEREAAAIEAKVYALIHSILDLHRFRDRRLLTFRYRGRSSSESIRTNEKIIADIIENSQMVKEELLYHPFECDIHMDFILTSLDKIVDCHSEIEGQIQSIPNAALKTEPSVNTEHTILGNTSGVQSKVTKEKAPTMTLKNNEISHVQHHIDMRKKATPSLPKLTTFLTATVGNILYEQGEYTDTGTLNKGESIHERKESRAN